MRSLLTRRPALGGAFIGLAWGASMRAWMRFISTDPEFSWGGTLGILGVSALAGGLLGLARRRLRAGGAVWWRLSGLSLLLLGSGGAVMWPTIVTGAAAIGRPRPAALRLILGLAAAAAQIPVVRDALIIPHGTVRAFVGLLWYLPMLAIAVWAFAVVFAPGPARRSRRPELAPLGGPEGTSGTRLSGSDRSA